MRPKHWLFTIPLRLRSLFRWAQADQELDDELHDHLERKTEEYVANGMAREEARRQARLDLGGIEQTKEKCRDARKVSWIHDLVQDLNYGLRILRKSPGFTAVAVVTLALGIGANTTVFSTLNAFLLREPPVRRPDRVAVISSVNPANVWAADRTAVSALDYSDWHVQSTSFTGMAAADFDHFTVSGGGSAPQWVPGARVSASFFDVLGVYPSVGRPIQPDENQAGRDQVVILSDRLWQERFGGDPSVVGQFMQVNGNRCTVIGVMPREFQLPQFQAEFWLPLVPLRDNLFGSGRDARYLYVFARLKAGLTERQANAEMQAIAERLAQAHPDTNRGWGAKVRTLHQFAVADSGSEVASIFISVAVGFVLLIACTNLTSLLLARNAARRQEFSVRSALGAGRLRLARQLLTECLLLSSAGGGLGILLAFWGVGFLRSETNWSEQVMTLARRMTVDSHALFFTLALSVTAALLSGLVPTIQGVQEHAGEGLKDRGHSSAGPGRNRLQRLLVIGQLALSLFLLVGAGLFVDLFVEEVHASVGFNSHNLLAATVPLRGLQYFSPRSQKQFFERARQRLATLPGVQSVALATALPFSFPNYVQFTIEGHPVAQPAEEPGSGYFAISPAYFETTQIPLLRGREFASSDTLSSAPVAVVNQAFANRFFPGQNPVGQHIRLDGRKQSSEIVGVVGNIREYLGQTQLRTELFVPFEQEPSGTMSFIVRTRTDNPASISDSLPRVVWAVDADQAIADIRTMERVIADSAQGDNLMAGLMASFALLALFMAAIGVFGLLSYVVGQRRHEMGIRLALGSEPRQILRLVLRRGMTLVVIGTAAGFLAALALPKLVAASFSTADFGAVHSTFVLAAGPIILLLVGLGACYVPARRAVRVDPMVALRYE
jgi:predicted permease